MNASLSVLHTEDPIFDGDSDHAIFLAGPTPRLRDVASWRPQAIDLFRTMGFTGTLIAPERRDRSVKIDYMDQVEWEHANLERCDTIMFWVPRELETMPAFTTNVEFGRYVGRKHVVYGRPDDAPKNRYLDWLYEKVAFRKPFGTLAETVASASSPLKKYPRPRDWEK